MTSSIASRFKEIRETLGISQTSAGKVCGVSKQTVIRWEQGENSIPSDAIELLGGHGFDVVYIMTGLKSVTKAPTPHLVRRDGVEVGGDELMDTLEMVIKGADKLKADAEKAIELLKAERDVCS